MFKELRSRSARDLMALNFPGYAIGGLSVGEPKPLMYEILAHTDRCCRRPSPAT